MIKKLCNPLFADDNIFLFDKDSGNVTFSSHEMGILNVDLNNNNFDDADFYEVDPKNIIHVRFLVWHNTLKKHKAIKMKITKELMSLA